MQIFKPSLKRRMQEEIETEPVGMRDRGREHGEDERQEEKERERDVKRKRERVTKGKRERERDGEGFVAASYIPCGGRVRTTVYAVSVVVQYR